MTTSRVTRSVSAVGVQRVVTALSLLLLLHCLPASATPSLHFRQVTVAIGRSVDLRASHLLGAGGGSWWPAMAVGEICKVEVLSHEPISMRVGLLEPPVFDCAFPDGSVTYTHFGSPQLNHDVVLLRVLRFTANATRTARVHLHVSVAQVPYVTVSVLRQLKVKGFFQLSRPIDARVLQFASYENCVVRVAPPGCDGEVETGAEQRRQLQQHRLLPARGRLVLGKERAVLDTMLEQSCAHFLHAGVRYRHLMPPTPDVDFVPILVEARVNGSSSGAGNAGRLHREWIQVRVSVAGALPNVAPSLQARASLLLELDGGGGGVAVLDERVLVARDDETSAHCPSANDLLFNVSDARSTLGGASGNFYHLLDADTAVTSFRQSDVLARRIFYRAPPLLNHGPGAAVFQTHINLTIIDGDFTAAPYPVTLRVVIRPPSIAAQHLPRLQVTSGLLLYEGQRRKLLPANLRLSGVAPASVAAMRVALVAGPEHGVLSVDGASRASFAWSELERGVVLYEHDDSDTVLDSLQLRLSDDPLAVRVTLPIRVLPKDDSDTVLDSLQLRLSDDPLAVRVTLPIRVLPKDDSAPTLVTNLGLQVEEGRRVVISSNALRARDTDSPDGQIVYVIATHPVAGHVLRSSFAHPFGAPVANFTQTDLDAGIIVYAHANADILRDQFEVVLRDAASPTPNQSAAPHRVHVTVVALDADPPRPSPAATLAASLNESDLVYVTRKMLHYVDRSAKDEHISYRVTTPPTVTLARPDQPHAGSSFADAGKLVLVSGELSSLSAEQRQQLPAATSFSQHQVSHNRLVYLSPLADIGATLLRVYFVFSVSDQSGNHLHGQLFNITVLPVNNKPPVVVLRPLVVYEGNWTTLSTAELSVSDQDTPLDDLELWLQVMPEYGILSLDGSPLNVGHTFGVADIVQQKVVYTHEGSEVPNDRITLVVSDRAESVMAVINVTVIAVDDAAVLQPPDSPSGLSVNEGDYIMISQDVLSAVDPDTGSTGVRFSLVGTPKFGNLLVGGNYSSEFTQDDLLTGKVQYVHGGGEVGKVAQSDDIHFRLLSDERPRAFRGRSGGLDDDDDEKRDVHTLRITILPVDNMPPALTQKAPLSVAEGGSVALDERSLVIVDDDSSTQKTLVVVARQPRHGFLENRGTAAGSEISGTGRPIDSFGLPDFQQRHIYYVQSVHSWMEPDVDSFVLYATDGIHRSGEIQFNVSIAPENDEPPQVFLHNFTVSQGSVKLLDSEILTITDLDRPRNFVTVTLKTPPRHGKMTLGKETPSPFARPQGSQSSGGGSSKGQFTHLSWEDFENVGVVYEHNGYASSQDNFTLLITDGVHQVTRTCFIDVSASSQSRPRVTRNAGLRGLSPGATAVISTTVLRAQADGTVPGAIHYTLERLPRHGLLQVLRGQATTGGATTSWTDVVDDGAAAFSQAEVDSLRVRYVHRATVPTSYKDGFNFVVSCGEFSTTLETFSIDIDAKKDDGNAVVMTVREIQVDSGDQVVLGPMLIGLSGKQVSGASVFRILGTPLEGRVALLQNDTLPISSFTVRHFLENQVVYVHESVDDTDDSQDHFRLALTDEWGGGLPLATADVTIHVSARRPSTTRPPPSTQHQSSSLLPPPLITLAQPLQLGADSRRVALSAAQLSSSRPQATTYRILRFPQLGQLELSGVTLSGRGESDVLVTQQDVEAGRLVYARRRGAAVANDYLIFVVHDPSRSAYDAQMEYRLDIICEPAAVKPVVRLEMRSPDTLEELGEGRQGFVFTDDHIGLSGVAVGSSLAYSVRRQPVHGRLENSGDEGSGAVLTFTPADVLRQRIRYVLNADVARVGATRDSFEVSVVDRDGINVALKSMELRWSIVYFSQREMEVCEDVASLSVGVLRASNLEHSAFVGIEALSKTAEVGQDFGASRVRQLQFDPGVTSVTWKLDVFDDGLEERSIESFSVRLRDPVNAVIDADNQLVVWIHDNNRDSCQKSRNAAKQADRLQTGSKDTSNGMQDCNSASQGQSAQITYGTSTIFLLCDGSSWVPQPKPTTSGDASDGERVGGKRRKNQQRQRQRERKPSPVPAGI